MRLAHTSQKLVRPEATVRIDLFTQADPEWYEDLSQLRPRADLLQIVRRVLPDAPFQRSGVWMHVTPDQRPLPDQGWKIHLSSIMQDAEKVLAIAAEVCARHGMRFKFVADKRLLRFVNSKMWPREASGKFVVLYPATTEEFLKVGAELDEALIGYRGPYVLSDRPFGKSRCVYYRYGGFRLTTEVQADGSHSAVIKSPAGETVPDERRPIFVMPEGIVDPVRAASAAGETESVQRADVPGRVRIAKRFVIDRSLYSSFAGFSSAGGVYRAFDELTGATVVLKEARPFIGTGPAELGQAISTLEHEHALLEALADTGVTPRPVGLFWDSGHRHRFLAEEFVEGMLLGPLLIGRNPVFDPGVSESANREYRDLLRRIWVELAAGVAAIHARKVCIGDLSLTNIIVDGWDARPSVRIVDLEAGWFDGEPPSHIFTPGFAWRPERWYRDDPASYLAPVGAPRGRADDIFALGRIFLGSLFPGTPLAGLDHAAGQRIFQAVAARTGLSRAAFELLERMTSPDASKRPAAEEVASFFSAESSVHGEPIAQPGTPYSDDLDRFSRDLVRGIRAAADVTRRDRVFPSDPRVFATNGVGLAHGAAGVLHALLAAGEPIDPDHRTWLLSQALDPDRLSPGLFQGTAGIAAVLSELGEDELAIHVMRQAVKHRIASSDPFMYGGAAGIGLAAAWLHGRTGDAGLRDDVLLLADRVLALRTPEGQWTNDAGDVPIGLLYGTAGISVFLLYASLLADSRAYEQAGESAIRISLGSHAVPEGRDFWTFPSYANRGAKRLRHYWADGSAGIGAALIRWIRVRADEELVEALGRLRPDTERGMTVFPQLLMGMSGLGMFHLDRYSLLGEKQALDVCDSLFRTIALFGVERPQGVAMPGDQLMRLSADLATGAAGVLLFAAHLRAAHAGAVGPSFGVAPFPDDLLPATSAKGSADADELAVA